MARKQSASPDSGSETGPASVREKPLTEIRIGKIKAVVWANHSENGVRHNVTFKRIFKRDTNSQWEQSDSFGRDDLPLLMEVARQAWLYIFENAGQQG